MKTYEQFGLRLENDGGDDDLRLHSDYASIAINDAEEWNEEFGSKEYPSYPLFNKKDFEGLETWLSDYDLETKDYAIYFSYDGSGFDYWKGDFFSIGLTVSPSRKFKNIEEFIAKVDTKALTNDISKTVVLINNKFGVDLEC